MTQNTINLFKQQLLNPPPPIGCLCKMSVVERSYRIFKYKKDIMDNIGTVCINLKEFMCSYEAKIARNANHPLKQRILTVFNTYG